MKILVPLQSRRDSITIVASHSGLFNGTNHSNATVTQ
jgi:hypothetical protein